MLDAVTGARVDHVAQRLHRLLRQRVARALAAVDDAAPVLLEALVVAGHALAQDLADGARAARRLEKVQRDAQEQRARRGGPERVGALRVREQHARHALQVVDAPPGLVRDVGQRVPARRARGLGQRVEQVHLLAVAGPEAGRAHPVLALDVADEHRAGPVEQVRDDHAHALAAARRRLQQHALLARQHQVAVAQAPQEDALAPEQARAPDLAAAGETRVAVQAAPARQQGGCPRAQGQAHAGGQAPQQRPAHLGALAVVVPVAQRRQRRGRLRLGANGPQEDPAREVQPAHGHQQRRGHGLQDLRRESGGGRPGHARPRSRNGAGAAGCTAPPRPRSAAPAPLPRACSCRARPRCAS